MGIRKIIFRGKRFDNGEWVFGDLNQQLNGNKIIFSYNKGFMAQADDVDPETICQYTGLNDKTGKKIFEGDIVRNFLCIDDHGDKLYEQGIAQYDEETLGFSVFDDENNRYSIFHMGNIEVIGNIFDNPELVESKVTP